MVEDLDDVRSELAALRAEVQELRTERDQRMTRRKLLTGGALAALATGAAAAPAAAADGDPVLLGGDNEAQSTTTIEDAADWSGDGPVLRVRATHFSGESGSAEDAAFFYAPDGYGIVSIGDVGANATGATYGLVAASDSTAVLALGDSVGVLAKSPVPLLLHPGGDADGPPSTTHAETGAFAVDGNGALWFCTSPKISDADPPPADPETLPRSWTRLNDQGPVFLDPSVRAVDTRQTGGIIAPGETRAISLDVPGVPDPASGALVNMTVTGTGRSGHITAWNADGTEPTTSTINWTAAGTTLANGTAIALGPSRTINVKANFTACHVVVDVIAAFPGTTRTVTP